MFWTIVGAVLFALYVVPLVIELAIGVLTTRIFWYSTGFLMVGILLLLGVLYYEDGFGFILIIFGIYLFFHLGKALYDSKNKPKS